jgi:hypothetical protein
VAVSTASRRPAWDGVRSTSRIGASPLGGSDAGAPEGETHAIDPRKELVVHPAAGELPPWQLAQWASRMGATSTSNTGVSVGSARSAEHAALSNSREAIDHVHLTRSAPHSGRTGRLTGALPVSEKTES